MNEDNCLIQRGGLRSLANKQTPQVTESIPAFDLQRDPSRASCSWPGLAWPGLAWLGVDWP